MGVIEIRPQPGPQETFLSSPADIAIYGGSAGGGKTFGLLMEPLRHVDNPDFGAVLFRRTYPQITAEGGMWDESRKIYPLLGAVANESDLLWRFASGARVKFAHLQHEKSVYDLQGSQIPLIGFDQLEHFSEFVFFYMLSRNRSTCGVRPYVRATVNPDADSWVAKLIEWWINQETGLPIQERAGVLRWFVRYNEKIIWADAKAGLEAEYPSVAPKSVTFIPASVYDNKILLNMDPGYLANLMALPLVERERLLGGNWKIRPTAGKVFNRAWFEIVDAVPAGGEWCRFWDFAATEKEIGKNDPDFTAGVLMAKVKGVYYVLDCYAAQVGPAHLDDLVSNIAQQDRDWAHANGATYRVRWEIEPAAAGKRENQRQVQRLDGFDARGVKPLGDKLVRAKPLSAQALVGNVKLLRAAWNEDWLVHMHNQPDIAHDDIMDGSTGSHNDLSGGRETKVA